MVKDEKALLIILDGIIMGETLFVANMIEGIEI